MLEIFQACGLVAWGGGEGWIQNSHHTFSHWAIVTHCHLALFRWGRDKRMRSESVWEAVSGSFDGMYFRVRVPTRELCYTQLMQGWHATSYRVLPAPGNGWTLGWNKFDRAPRMSCLILDTWVCWHASSPTVSLHFSCCGIAPVVKQFWQWVMAYCKWHLHRHHTTLYDTPTHELFDPWHLQSWLASSPTVS